MTFEYGYFQTADTDAARAHNEALTNKFGGHIFGIEVTNPMLAKLCAHDLDPQHKGQGGSATSAAYSWPADKMPIKGWLLCTVRWDRDAFCAMAVIELIAEGRKSDISLRLIEWLEVLDDGIGNARQARPDLAQDRAVNAQGIVLGIVAKNDQRWPDLASKVHVCKRVLTGEMTPKEMWEIRDLEQQDKSTDGLADMVVRLGKNGDIGFLDVVGRFDVARDWLNQRFPVGLVLDRKRFTRSGGHQERWSVVRQFRPVKVFDRFGFEKAINADEAKARGVAVEELFQLGQTWGGPQNIVTSPQGEGNGSRLIPDHIQDRVVEHHESGVVS